MILDKDIVCFCCDETFTAEDDYKAHMIKDHGIRKNIDNCVNVAKKKAGLPVIIKQEVIEEVTLDDSDEDDASDDIIVDNQHLATDSFNKIESEAREASRRILTNIFQLVEDCGSESVPVFSEQDNHDSDDYYSSELSITKIFDNIRDKVKNIDMEKLLTEDKENDKIASVEELLSEDPKDEVQHRKETEKETETVMINGSSKSEAGKLIKKVKSMKTIYLCPMENCSFSTNKEGMKMLVAAQHLGNVHKVRPDDVNGDGRFKWRKIKTQFN